MGFEFPQDEFGLRAQRRLIEEGTAWLTVVDAKGAPQPAPIWFLWEGDTALIYSDRNAKRLTHIAANPRATLNLDTSANGDDVVVLTGQVAVDPDAPKAGDHPDYLAKYGARIEVAPFGPQDEFDRVYDVALRFTPRRLRGF